MVSPSLRAAIFPLADHFPLAENPSAAEKNSEQHHQTGVTRPFGLRYAVKPTAHSPVKMQAVHYDEQRQIGLIDHEGIKKPFTTFDAPMTIESTGEVARPTYDEIHDYDH
ncbi:MAG: putative ATP-grasp-modified RiPP [Corynebacteriales bacterium]|nr:putative ATP-grasp-modified RiPP [Mycobacteriales bacterium]